MKWLAIVWLALGGAHTSGALLQGLLMVLGVYDPVSHDGLPRDSYLWYMVWSIGFPILYLATAKYVFKIANTESYDQNHLD